MLEPHARSRPFEQSAAVYGHSRSRTTSSTLFPNQDQVAGQMSLHVASSSSQPGLAISQSRRSPSVNTFSTTSTMPPPAAYRVSSTTDLSRSVSARSAGTTCPPSGYVALLRKQKATVWCDRAQYEDPRIVAQQRAARKRANLEVVAGAAAATHAASRTNTGISATGKVAAKIRHHGKTPVVGYAPGENHVGVGGVPMRLSATEVEGETSDEDDGPTAPRIHHRRTGSSGRSSTGSGRRGLSYRTSNGPGTQLGQRWSAGDAPAAEQSESPVGRRSEEPSRPLDDAASGKARSSRSGSSAERADDVGELGSPPRLASKSLMYSALTREKSVKSADELKRRGSVDERTATLTSGRLFIANPD